MLRYVKLRSSDLLPLCQFSIVFDSDAFDSYSQFEGARGRGSLLVLSVTCALSHSSASLTYQIRLLAAYAANKLHPTAFPDVWIARQRIQTCCLSTARNNTYASSCKQTHSLHVDWTLVGMTTMRWCEMRRSCPALEAVICKRLVGYVTSYRDVTSHHGSTTSCI